jgi:hypothetical protein
LIPRVGPEIKTPRGVAAPGKDLDTTRQTVALSACPFIPATDNRYFSTLLEGEINEAFAPRRAPVSVITDFSHLLCR